MITVPPDLGEREGMVFDVMIVCGGPAGPSAAARVYCSLAEAFRFCPGGKEKTHE